MKDVRGKVLHSNYGYITSLSNVKEVVTTRDIEEANFYAKKGYMLITIFTPSSKTPEIKEFVFGIIDEEVLSRIRSVEGRVRDKK